MTPVQAALELIKKEMLEVRRDGTLWRIKRRESDKTFLKKPHKVGSPFKGYRAYGFNYKGKWKLVRIHCLVYTYFHGPIPKGKEIHHKDNNKSNNILSNLTAITHAKNMRLAADDGLYKSHVGSNNPCARIDENKVREICQHINNGWGAAHTARKTKIAVHIVYNILRGATWQHLECVQNLKWPKYGTRKKTI